MIDMGQITELRSDLGEETFNEVVGMFLLEVQSGIEKLDPARDLAELSAEFHMLKGSSLSLGLTELAKICGEAEAKSGSGDPNCFDKQAFQMCFDQSKAALLEQVPAAAQ